MFAHLTLAVRDRIIEELKNYWSDDPRYEGFSNNIQGKYSFEERPQFGMVVRTGGANNVILSNDNFIGTIEGQVSLANVKGFKSYGSIEWVRESLDTERDHGVYHAKIYDDPTKEIRGYDFHIYFDKYQYRTEESVVFISDTEIQLLDIPLEGSLRIIERPSFRNLSSQEFTVNYDTGLITLNEALPRGLSLYAKYTVKMPTIGPFNVRKSTAYHNLIKGAVLAFGRKVKDGDQQIILVAEERESIAHEYGGRWDVSVDLEMIARDVHSQADIADRTVVWIWSTLRKKLTNIGIDISDVSLGGEAEEVYDENGDDYFYTATISFTVQTNWFIHLPLIIPILSITDENVIPVERTEPTVGVGNKGLVQRLL